MLMFRKRLTLEVISMRSPELVARILCVEWRAGNIVYAVSLASLSLLFPHYYSARSSKQIQVSP